MKRLCLLWMAILCIAATPTPQPIPTPLDVSKIDFSQFKPEEIEATERHRDELKGEVNQAQEKQAEVIQNQGSSIADVQKAAEDTRIAQEAYRTAAEAQITKGNKAIAALEHVLKKLHLAKWILCGIWTAFCAILFIKFKGVGMYFIGVGYVAGIAYIWIWI